MSNLTIVAYPPVNQLKRYVRRILITLGNEQTNEIVPIGPTGFAYLTYSRYPIVLHYSYQVITSNEQLYLTGQIKEEQPFFKVRGKFFHVGLELMPAAPWYLFNVSGKDLVDRGLVFSQLYPELSRDFRIINAAVKDPEATAGALQQLLIDLLPQINPPIRYIDDALTMIDQQSGNLDLSELLQSLNISERHFRRQFNKVVGIGAKQYCKIIQFNTVFDAIRKGNKDKLYDLALLNGYYDHAHFINDFKTYLGQSPRHFLKSEYPFLKNYLGTFKP